MTTVMSCQNLKRCKVIDSFSMKMLNRGFEISHVQKSTFGHMTNIMLVFIFFMFLFVCDNYLLKILSPLDNG